jgi:pimeloyl-ACP methyl ester carboxylesterase
VTVDLLFDAAGPADAPPIVLVHGSVVTRKMWLPQLRGLSDGYRVLAPDLPGHGALAHTPFTFSSAVRVLAEFIGAHAEGRALVAGMSLGGYVAIELAAAHPDRVAGLVLSGCSVNFTGVLGAYLKVVSALMRRGWLTQSRAKAEQKVRRLFPPSLADVAEAQLQAGVYPDSLGPSFAEMAGRDFAAILSQFPGPSLILNGERDRTSRKGDKPFVAAQRVERVRVVPGAGHACSIDQPEIYNRSIREFAESIGWPSAYTARWS